METLKGIMIKYANERGGGLPLTPEEICNCVVLWAQQYAPTAITINGGDGISITNELVDDNKKVITIEVNPATINVGELVGLFEGSDTVVVDENETNDKIEIHLDQDIVTRISKSLVLPEFTPTEDVVPVVGVNGAQRYEPLSSLGGGGGTKLYRHKYTTDSMTSVYIVTTRSTAYTQVADIAEDFRLCKIIKAFDTSVGYSATFIRTNIQTNSVHLECENTAGYGLHLNTSSVEIEEL